MGVELEEGGEVKHHDELKYKEENVIIQRRASLNKLPEAIKRRFSEVKEGIEQTPVVPVTASKV
jgi:hypothetical protein